MEANMSPNLSSAHFPPNRPVKKFNVKQILGLVAVIEVVFCLQVIVRAGHPLHAPAGRGHPGLRQVHIIQCSVRYRSIKSSIDI
jgi:hypothetical protein